MRKLSVLLVAVGLALTSLTLTPSAAPAAAPPPSTPTRGGASWLANRVNQQGFIPNPDGQPNFGNTSQAAIALSAAGLNRNTVDRIETYLAANAGKVAGPTGTKDPGSLANLILGAVASGRNPRAFGGYDLVATLQSTERAAAPDAGLFGTSDPTYDGAYRQGLVLWALHLSGVGADANATGWLSRQQCSGGGWTPYRANTAVPCPPADSPNYDGPDTNSTAVALLGLTGQGVNPPVDAKAFLYRVRTGGGGWAYRALSSDAADANSTGLVLQTLITVTGSNDPVGLNALLTFQIPCGTYSTDQGGVAFQPVNGVLTANTMATIQALPAIAGRTMGRTADPNSYEDIGCASYPARSYRWLASVYQSFLFRQPVGQEYDVAYGVEAGTTSRRAVVDNLTHSPEYLYTVVRGFYLNTLNREPDQPGADYWVNELRSGRRTVAEVGAFFYASDEYYANRGGGTDRSWVTDLYLRILHRQPDQGGLDYWTAETASTGRYSVAIRFFQSVESRRDRVDALYRYLLGRPAEPGGLDYWSQRVLYTGDLDLAADLASSAEYFDRAQVLFP